MSTVINITKDQKRENRGTATTDPSTGVTTVVDRECWIVTFSDALASEQDARTAVLMSGTSTIAAVPRNGDASTNNTSLICRSVDAIKDVDSPSVYRVTGEFSTRQFIGNTAAGVDIQVTGALTKEKNYVTYDGHNVVNCAGDFLTPLTERDFYDEAIQISWIATSIASIVPVFKSIRGKVCDTNGASFTVHGQSFSYTYRQLKVANAGYGVTDAKTIGSAWRVHIDLLARWDRPLPGTDVYIGAQPDPSGTNATKYQPYTGTSIAGYAGSGSSVAGFTEIRPNVGLNYLDGSTNKVKLAFMTKYNQQQTAPQPLDVDGTSLAISWPTSPHATEWLLEPIEYEASFSALTALIPT